jgi:hypothetical protein
MAIRNLILEVRAFYEIYIIIISSLLISFNILNTNIIIV